MIKKNKSLSFGQYLPNDKVLNKKIPENPKYRNVRPAIDTGKNVRRHIDELKEKHMNIGYKKDEIFKRIKFSSYISLAINVAKILLNPDISADYEVADGCENSVVVQKEENAQVANVLMGIGEIDLRNEKKRPPAPLPKVEIQSPYLLLDVRERDNYLEGHLRTAKHYPSALLSRSTGYETEDMKQYKNSQDIIIVYDDDESIAARVATTLVERGYENVFLLSGGLKLGNEVLPRKLMNLICSDQFPISKMGACGMVLMKTPSSEYFSQEDVDNIDLYMETIPCKGYNRMSSSKTRSPLNESERPNSRCQKIGDGTEFASKPGSLTYRKDSAGSCRKQAQIRIPSGSVTDARVKSKKVPWK